jgi:uncharacterized RDD family membrane protein YckC
MISPFTRYIGFGQRALAFVADLLWLTPLVLILSYVICGQFECVELELPQNLKIHPLLDQIQWQAILIEDILPALVVLWFWMAYAATPGKLLIDSRIVDAETGKPITFKQGILRYLGYFVSAFGLGLGFLWVIWDERKQGWHDKIAKTVVILHDEANVPLYQLEKYYR